MAKAYSHQLYAFDRRGRLDHATPVWWPRVGPSVIRRHIAAHQTWADGVAAQWPDCPTAASRRRTAFVLLIPFVNGSPDKAQRRWFDNRGRPLQGDPRV